MKHTTDYQWAHINCALWIPEGEPLCPGVNPSLLP